MMLVLGEAGEDRAEMKMLFEFHCEVVHDERHCFDLLFCVLN